MRLLSTDRFGRLPWQVVQAIGPLCLSISPYCVVFQWMLAQCCTLKKVLSLFLYLISDGPASLTSAFVPTPVILCMLSLSTQVASGKITVGILFAKLSIFFPFCALTNFFKKLTTAFLSWCHSLIPTVSSGFQKYSHLSGSSYILLFPQNSFLNAPTSVASVTIHADGFQALSSTQPSHLSFRPFVQLPTQCMHRDILQNSPTARALHD